MREVKNTETGKVRLVPDATAEEIRKGKHFARQGWVIVEHAEPPYPVLKFQEAKKAEQITEIKEPVMVVEIDEKPSCCKQAENISALTVNVLRQRIGEFSKAQLEQLVNDPRKSVSELAKKTLDNGQYCC